MTITSIENSTNLSQTMSAPSVLQLQTLFVSVFFFFLFLPTEGKVCYFHLLIYNTRSLMGWVREGKKKFEKSERSKI